MINKNCCPEKIFFVFTVICNFPSLQQLLDLDIVLPFETCRVCSSMQAIARSTDIFSFVMENFIDNMEDLHHFYNSQLLQLRYITDKFLSPHFFKSVAFRIIILWPKTSESADYFVTPVPPSFSPLPCSNRNVCLVMVKSNSIESSSCL